MIEDMLEELKELVAYKKKYEAIKKDQEKMADYIYNNELKKYYDTSYEDRCKKYIDENCKCCRCKGLCETINEGLDADILKPIKNKDWFPSYKGCENFECD